MVIGNPVGRASVRAVLMVGVALVLATCSSGEGETYNTDPTCESSVTMRVAWAYETRGNIGKMAMDASGNAVYAPLKSLMQIVALDPVDGTLIWTFALGQSYLSYVVQGPDGHLYANSGSWLVSVNTQSGTERWRLDLTHSIYHRPAFGTGGRMYVANSDNAFEQNLLHAIDGATGDVLWQFTSPSGLSQPDTGADGTIYAAGGTTLYAIDPVSGTPRWEVPFPDSVSYPKVGPNGDVYVSCTDNHLYCVNPADGQQRWSFATTTQPRVAVFASSGTIYLSDDSGHLYAIDHQTGSRIWEFTSPFGFWWPGIDAMGTIYLSAQDTVYAISHETGQTIWSYKHDTAVHMPTAGPSGLVFMPTNWDMGSENTIGWVYALRTGDDVVSPEDLICQPCTLGCQDGNKIKRCLPDGSGYELHQKCGTGLECSAGECVEPTPCELLCGMDGESIWVDLTCGTGSSTSDLTYDSFGRINGITITYSNGMRVSCSVSYNGMGQASGSCSGEGESCNF